MLHLKFKTKYFTLKIKFLNVISYWGHCRFKGVRLSINVGYIAYTRHFGSYQESKLRGTPRRKGRYSAVKSSLLSWAEQYKKCV